MEGQQRVEVDDSLLDEALALYERGYYVDSYHAAVKAGPLQLWKGARAQTFGSRLCNNIAASRLAALLICRARHEHPDSAEVGVHYTYYLHHRRGPLAAWRHCLKTEKLPGISPDLLADLKARRASIAADHRDFDTAWRLWDEAVALHERSPWLLVERCSILLAAEQREEALAAMDEALALRPWFRPAVQYRGRILHMLRRTEEAVTFLTEAMAHLQSCGVAGQLVGLKRDLDDHAGMEELVARFEALAPLAEETEKLWATARRVDIHLLRGDFPQAATAADALPGSYYERLALRLREPGVTQTKRRLPFEFVHQKHNTCAPATLAALAHYWGCEVTMEQIVDAICYDGTYDHNERSWALANGFVAREFKITLEVAQRLIDLGIPFDLSTVEVSSAHAQAVIGYDLLKQTLFIQDPSEPHYREVEAEEFLTRYTLTGPRGMVLVPQDKAHLLEGLDLPEAEIYDLSHRFNKALAEYDVQAAALALEALEQRFPGHRLTLLARMSQANFDGNEVERLQWISRLLELHPDDERLLNWRYNALKSMGHRNERLELLREVVRTEKAHPSFMKNLVDELMDDARDWGEARLLAWRVHARMPGDAGMVMQMADMLRRTQPAANEEWLTFYRFAAALASKDEGLAQTWFALAQSQGRGEEALDWLRQRWRAFGSKSGAPALTLARALDSLGRTEMLEVLREAVALRPDDGALLLYQARVDARTGQYENAAAVLERAAKYCAPGAWRRASASLKRVFGDHVGEMATWREILQSEPLALDAHRAVAADLAAARGQDSVLQHLSAACLRFPSHQGLAQLHIGWLRDFDLKQAAQEAERFIALHPADPWARRELALIWKEAGAGAKALPPAQQAVEIAPDQAASHAILGHVLAGEGQAAAAEKCFRRAIELDVNYSTSFDGLLALKPETPARREALAFIRGEMIRQVLDGSGLHAYRDHAFPVLQSDELLAELREVHQARPDLWEAWSVLLSQLMDSGRRDEAILLAQQATLKFALIPGAWRDMATVWRTVDKPDVAIQCARHVVKLSPDWSDGWGLLASLLEDADHHDEAVATLRAAQVRLPLDMALRGRLAGLLWRVNAREEAWQIAERTAQQDPAQTWAWNNLQSWAGPLQKQARLIEVGTELTQARPDEARSWDIFARLLPLERITDVLAAIDRAVALNPKLVEAYDFRMETLARLGRLNEAEATLERTPWPAQAMPHNLLGRQAWLRFVRGNTAEGMRLMRAVLDRHRDYYWGWETYAQWAEQQPDLKEWKRAADQMMRLAPRSPAVFCNLGDHALRANERQKAVQYFQQALQLDPGSPHAAHELLSMHWEKREMEAIAKTAAALPDAGVAGLIKRVYLMLAAAHCDDVAQVRQDLLWLATHPDLMGPLLKAVLDYFQATKKKLSQILDEVLETVAKNDTIGPAFAVLWVHREGVQRRWQCWRHLALWLPRLAQRLDSAIMQYLDEIGEAAAGNPHVPAFIAACGPELRQRGEVWGKVGYALAASHLHRECADWLLPDYLRPDAEGWVLWNLVLSLRQLLKPDQAAEVSIHVVETGICDSTWPSHVAYAAFGYAWAGQYDKARSLTNSQSVEAVDVNGRLMLCMARALCVVMPLAPAQGRFYFKTFLASSKAIIKGHALGLQMQRDYDGAVARMKAHTGAKIMPWQRARPRETQYTETGQGSGRKTAIFVAVILLFQVLRHCPESGSHRSSSPVFSPDSQRRIQELIRSQESYKPPYEPSIRVMPSSNLPTLSPEDLPLLQSLEPPLIPPRN